MLKNFSEKEIENLYKGISTGWNDRLTHVYRVYNLCLSFLRKYPSINRKVLLTAVLLHDIGHKRERNHAINGAKMARALLKAKNFTSKEIEKISDCIKTHNLKGKEKPASIEAKILSDCDRLDVIGIENWLYVIDNEIEKGKEIDEVLQACENWEKEWFELGVKFYTKLGKIKQKEIKKEKERIIKLIKKFNLKKLRRGVLVLLFNKRLDRILLVKRKKDNYWGVVAGKIESRENAIRTAMREIEEEVGLKIKMFDLFPTTISIKPNTEMKSLDVLFNFCAIIDIRENFCIGKKNKEILKAEWFALDDLPLKIRDIEIQKNLKVFKNVDFER